jgi:hypothetical protein
MTLSRVEGTNTCGFVSGVDLLAPVGEFLAGQRRHLGLAVVFRL